MTWHNDIVRRHDAIPGWWAVQPGDPRTAGFNGVYYRQDTALAGQYVNGGSNVPAGTVS